MRAPSIVEVAERLGHIGKGDCDFADLSLECVYHPDKFEVRLTDGRTGLVCPGFLSRDVIERCRDWNDLQPILDRVIGVLMVPIQKARKEAGKL